jgi:hypothetical protein
MAKENVTRVVPDDTIGYYIGLALFAALIPILFVVSWLLSPTGAGAGAPPTHTPAAATAPAP